MTLLITGASGHLGRLVIDRLLARGVAPSDIVAGARDPQKIVDLQARGVRVARVDYDGPASVVAAMDGVDRVLLISGSEVGRRIPQHQAVIDAAANANVQLLAYTSVTRADTTSLLLAPDHLATERAIAASGVPAVILRNNWYTENFTPALEQARQTGILAASVGEGRIPAASRADYADAAAAVLLSDGHAGKTYELAGDTALDHHQIAAAMAQVLGREVVYLPLTTERHLAALNQAGLDDATAGFITGIDASIRAGELDITDHTLADLIGRPTTPITETLRPAI